MIVILVMMSYDRYDEYRYFSYDLTKIIINHDRYISYDLTKIMISYDRYI